MSAERDIDFARLPVAETGDWLRWLPTTGDWRAFVLPFGKWKGSRLSTVANREPSYLWWAAQSIPGCTGARCREAVADMKNFQTLATVYMRMTP